MRWGSKAGEVLLWGLSPLALGNVGFLLGLLSGLGARTIGVLGVLVLAAGAFLVFWPQRFLRLGRARGVGMIYAGLLTASTLLSADFSDEAIRADEARDAVAAAEHRELENVRDQARRAEEEKTRAKSHEDQRLSNADALLQTKPPREFRPGADSLTLLDKDGVSTTLARCDD